MLIANKLEDNAFAVDGVYEASGRKYSIDKILDYEITVVQVLNWKINPPTANMWANRLAKQWDDYLDDNPGLVNSYRTTLSESISDIKFKCADPKVLSI